MMTGKNTSPVRTAGEMIGDRCARVGVWQSGRESQDGKNVR